MFIKYKALDKIILNRDIKFIVIFWEVFMAEQGIKAVILTVYYPQTDGQIKKLN